MCDCHLPANGGSLGGFASCRLGWHAGQILRIRSVEVGISKAFDGKHPCDLCLSIAKNKQTEKKQASRIDTAKIYLVAHAQSWTLQPPRYSWRLRTTIALMVGC